MNLNDWKSLLRYVFNHVFWALVLVGLASSTPIGRDDADPGQWGARSGMRLHTDSLTGCQYLANPSGGITARVDRAGKHVGCGEVRP